jgi:predicted RNase H-like HicB family nuclease
LKNINYYLSIKYPFIIQQDEDGSFFLKYPDLPGCFTCAQTLDEVIKMGEDAKKGWLEIAIENNQNIPEPKTNEEYSGNFRIRMPKELHKELALQAESQGTSMNQYCIYLLSKENEKNKHRKKEIIST